MVEIKFFKELPVKSLNTSQKVLKVLGADIYVDCNANRYAYIQFENISSYPMFSLYFIVRQYDSFGSFIKEIHFSLPNIFVKRGKYTIEQPVSIEQECDGIEVFVSYAEFSKFNFSNDQFSKNSKLGNFVSKYFTGAPASVSQSEVSSLGVAASLPKVEEPIVEEVKEELPKTEPLKVEEPKEIEKPELQNLEVSVSDTIVSNSIIRKVGNNTLLANILLAALVIILIFIGIYISNTFM